MKEIAEKQLGQFNIYLTYVQEGETYKPQFKICKDKIATLSMQIRKMDEQISIFEAKVFKSELGDKAEKLLIKDGAFEPEGEKKKQESKKKGDKAKAGTETPENIEK